MRYLGHVSTPKPRAYLSIVARLLIQPIADCPDGFFLGSSIPRIERLIDSENCFFYTHCDTAGRSATISTDGRPPKLC